MHSIRVLATDMDGTFIPLDGNEENRRDLEVLGHELQQQDVELVYVTGRHHDLVLEAIETHALPAPRWLICDVGASIYESAGVGTHQQLASYQQHLAEIIGSFTHSRLADRIADEFDLRLQEDEKQGRFKLSYYCDASELSSVTAKLEDLLVTLEAPYRIIASVDPFTGDGLVDFLPRGVSKEFALRWWVQHTKRDDQSVVFAGDSANDLAALTAGYRSIIVANADASVVEEAQRAHAANEWQNRLFLASKPATSGVLEGLRYFT